MGKARGKNREIARGEFCDEALLEQRVRFCELFDVYAPILTARQRAVCELMLRDDLSASELADELGVTRQGVHDLVRRTREHLEKIERELGLKKLLDDRDELARIVKRHEGALPREFLDEIMNLNLSKPAD
jgi:predicted DNA-binding protein YlxM (UPF0122 family)